MKKLYRYLIYILPLMLVFSYFPLMKMGENETMYFELSLPLIWLVVFDVFSLVLIVKKYRAEIFTKIFGSIFWWLFPIFVTFSVIWSLNPLRGFLTVGLMWLLFFAVLSFYELREYLDGGFWKIFWRWFFGSAIFTCVWCVVQCILDVAGVSQEVSLLCDGCVYQMFGFPHPNGFAIEPQFMGNLLLAPIMVVGVNLLAACPSDMLQAAQTKSLRSEKHIASKLAPLLFFVLSATLFLTFSRGAIYACIVGLSFLFTFSYFKAKKTERKSVCFSILKTIGIYVVAFLFALNLQGVFSAISPTDDTYFDGVAKVVNHLSLGAIEIRGDGEVEPVENSGITEGNNEVLENGPVENSGKSKAAFDGYVAESTDTRLRLADSALMVWKQDFATAMVGVGIGGAGQALYNNGFSPAPREIVQNEYASLLLETGVIGVSLFTLIILLAIRVILKMGEFSGMILALLAAYGVTLIFFSGFPNAMQIILIPGLLICFAKKVK